MILTLPALVSEFNPVRKSVCGYFKKYTVKIPFSIVKYLTVLDTRTLLETFAPLVLREQGAFLYCNPMMSFKLVYFYIKTLLSVALSPNIYPQN